jgi:hypothetical protein
MIDRVSSPSLESPGRPGAQQVDPPPGKVPGLDSRCLDGKSSGFHGETAASQPEKIAFITNNIAS